MQVDNVMGQFTDQLSTIKGADNEGHTIWSQT